MRLCKKGTKRSRRSRLAVAAIAGAASLAALTTAGGGIAGAAGTGAAPVTAPSAGAPFFNQNNASEIIRGAGSDTTFFIMQKISDLYTGAGLYGCTLNTGGAGQLLFDGVTQTNNSYTGVSGTVPATPGYYYCQAGGQSTVTYGPFNNSGSNGIPAGTPTYKGSDVSTTDDADNWNRTEVLEGVNSVGSGAGQKGLCGAQTSPDAVDFARSSKPAGVSGCTLQELGYAKDGVPAVDFPTINPSTFGTSTFSNVASSAAPNVAYNTINGGVVGPVAAGWLPGDNPSGSSFNGTKLTNITNTGALDTSVATRLWCLGTINDWGQLENLGPNLEVNVDTTSGSSTVTIDSSSGSTFPATIANGQTVTGPYSNSGLLPSGTTVSSGAGTGTLTLSNSATATGKFTLIFATGAAKLAVGSGEPIGVPIRILGVNTASGTTFTFSQFAQGSTEDSGTCTDGSGGNYTNKYAANDPNAATAPSGNPAHVALENNAHQLELFSGADFPTSTVDQAIEEATSIYFMSYGVESTNPYVAATTIGSTNYAVNILGLNGKFPGATTELNNSYPTARTLSNIIIPTTVRQSTAGFMNWICDSNADFQKGTDASTGTNYDQELNSLISTQYGFPRLTDLSTPVAVNPPADNTTAPNDDCVAQIPVTADGSSTITVTGGGNFPASIIPYSSFSSAAQSAGAGTVAAIAGVTANVPSGTEVTSSGGGSSLTLSNPIPASNYTLEFYGVPPVLTSSSTP